MSRSCQSGMPSITGTTWARTMRASPAMRSETIGFFLWGIALEPFCPLPNGSDSSRTSVRWPCRTSSANASQTVAIDRQRRDPLADAVADARPGSARRRPGQPELRRDRLLDRRVDVGVRADRAADLARRRRPRGRCAAGRASGPSRRRGRRPGGPRRRARRGCRACGRPGPCRGGPGRGRAAPRPAVAASPAAGRSPRPAAAPARCRAGRSDVMPKCT